MPVRSREGQGRAGNDGVVLCRVVRGILEVTKGNACML
jgi:hypothetical protein